MPRGTEHPNIPVPAVQMTGGDDTLQRLAVDLFMRRVSEVKPEIIRDFAANVFTITDDSRRGPKMERPSPEYVAWAERSLLPPRSAVFGWALRTLLAWKTDPQMRQALQLPETILRTGCVFNGAINTEYPTNLALARRDPAEPLEAFPDIESGEAFIERARRHWRARRGQYQVAHNAMPPRRGVERHYDWLARFLFGGEKIPDIQRRDHIAKWDNVKHGIDLAARTLRIPLRE